ncbi:MAG TPA: GGDEF domain-containing protein [Candidatus Halomonas stercoripullorum]|uniref:diguanylate cyclase n=1 Tax=Candidatus Halomonas stercoripullorum TaxID=2838617 RepID=A0A9D1WNW6_9GAMM|nr:GGDEF domain-containing protein [Candidatus Halomonas stercoripullorum]
MTRVEARQGASLDWRVEFRNTALESQYRRSMRMHDALQIRRTLWIVATLFLLFIPADYSLLGSGTTFTALTLMRCLVAISCLTFVRVITKRPVQAHRPLLLNLVYFITLNSLLLSILLHPGHTGLHISSLMAASLTIYLLVPNRLGRILFWNAYLNLGFLLITWLWKPMDPGMLKASLLILAFTNLMGWMTFSRLNQLQRKQFALLMDERSTNRQLQTEINERQLLESQLRQMASTDPLTGIPNRRHFFELAEREFSRAQREGTPLAICMVDIDRFKVLNDRHGHAVGDLVLSAVASCCASVLRDTDIIGRYGGEEFVIALPQADLATAEPIAERLRQKVHALDLPMIDGETRLSVTVGISQVLPQETALEMALQRADAALYAGKARSRNCVIIASETSAATNAET